jgi:transposase
MNTERLHLVVRAVKDELDNLDVVASLALLRQGLGTRLLEVQGIGPVLAVRLLGRTGRASQFRSAAAFASYGHITKPLQAGSTALPLPLSR